MTDGANVKVGARVGEFTLSVAGYVSPFASIVMTSQEVFIKSTTSDEKGDFSISKIAIKRGFSQFCLQAIDFKRVGESITCITTPPATESITKKDLFLPPTLGLSRTTIEAGGKVFAFGYTMPGAFVTIHVGPGKTVTGYADRAGFYQFEVNNLSAGTYQLYATAQYKFRDSLKPSKTVELKALSWWERIIAFIRDLIGRFVRLLTSLSLGPLWFGLPILILIIILILKVWPERFSFVYESKLIHLLTPYKRHHKHLHHE